MKSLLAKQIEDLKRLTATVKPQCEAYCADKSFPLADRWEIFCIAPDKECSPFQEIPSEDEVGLTEEISPYDDWCLERHETFDVCDKINNWEESIGASWGTGYNQVTLDLFKEYYMATYTGSFVFDW